MVMAVNAIESLDAHAEEPSRAPLQPSSRKMCASSNADRRIALSLRADERSRPNGFSTMTRAPFVQLAFSSC